MSFTERYQGTQWAARRAPQQADPDRPRPHGASPLLAIGLVLISAAAVIGIVSVVLVGLQPAPSVRDALNAAYATTYTPRPTPWRPTPAAPPSPTPVTAVVEPTAAPPRGTLDPGGLPDDPLMAFAERVHRGDASYAVRASGAIRLGTARTEFESEMSADGPDRAGWYTFSVAGLRGTTDIVIKDGVGYVRPKGEDWTREASPSGMPGDFLLGFTGGDVAMLTEVGVERRNGRTLHHLRLPNIDWQTLRGLLGQASTPDVRDMKLDIWVTSTGVPVRARFTIDASYLEQGVQMDVKADLQYRFTEYGEPHPVQAPEHFRDGDGSSGANS